jgi:predicted nucleotidyltransferase
MVAADGLTALLRQFVATISREIVLREVYLFGSYATGTNREESDIDVAVVSDEFQGIRFYDRQRVHQIIKNDLLDVFHHLEIHPFKTEHFTPDNPFVEEILRTGRRITP